MELLFLFGLLEAILAFSVQASTQGNTRSRMFQGQDAKPSQFPYMAKLIIADTNADKFICGGVLLNEIRVLTSAHCLDGGIHFEVYLGSTHVDEPAVLYELNTDSLIVHPDWNPDTSLNDIALIKIPQTSICDNISPVHLPEKAAVHPTYAGESAIASGWGWMSNNGPPAKRLQWAQMSVISNEFCARFFHINFDTEMCTFSRHASICEGDSGGPLVLESTGELIGLVNSLDENGCENNRPNIYTRITPYLDWIEEHIS